MRSIICFSLSAVLLAGALCGCDNKKKTNNDNNGQSVTEAVTTTAVNTDNIDNTGKQFLGKWETYKVKVNGETYETFYEDYLLSRISFGNEFACNVRNLFVLPCKDSDAACRKTVFLQLFYG